jgi:hypothetical protein
MYKKIKYYLGRFYNKIKKYPKPIYYVGVLSEDLNDFINWAGSMGFELNSKNEVDFISFKIIAILDEEGKKKADKIINTPKGGIKFKI